MLTKIKIEGFKSIENESLQLTPLTILTGVNSSGKSTVIQALLLLLRFTMRVNHFSLQKLISPYSNPRDIRNKFTNQSDTSISVEIKANENIDKLELITKESETKGATLFRGIVSAKKSVSEPEKSTNEVLSSKPPVVYHYEQTDEEYIEQPELFYLNANRIGPQAVTLKSDTKVGDNAELLFGYYEEVKGRTLPDCLVKFSDSKTISYQVSQWVSLISGSNIELKTEVLESNEVNVTFDSDGLKDISPFNLGAGISYLAKVVIICLIAKKGDLVVIENPEIHLHPKAQASLGGFFAFIAKSGIQLMIETHCEHLINKLAHQVYKEELNENDVVIHYKNSVKEPFRTLNIDGNGEFNDNNAKLVTFPKGFFDATLAELMEMR